MFIYDENTKEERLIVKYKVELFDDYMNSWIVRLYSFDAEGEFEEVYQDECLYEEVGKLLEKIKRRNNGLSTN